MTKLCYWLVLLLCSTAILFGAPPAQYVPRAIKELDDARGVTPSLKFTLLWDGTKYAPRFILQSDVVDLVHDLAEKEPVLGNPSVTGYVLSSTTGGVRSWIVAGSGPQGEQGPPGADGADGATGATGPAGPSVWGGITGTMSTQTDLQSALDLKAPLASPTFTGTVTLPSGQALIAPALGTPASGVMTNVTGTASGLTAGNVTTNANLTGHVTSTGNAAVLGSFTHAQLNTAVSDANVAAAGANADITSISTLTSFGTGSVATLFDSSGLLRFGGATSSFPGLKRGTVAAEGIAVRLANDASYAPLELGGLRIYTTSSTNRSMDINGFNPNISLINSLGIRWDASATAISGTVDTGIFRNAAGVVEINSGTPGTYRDLINRYHTLNGSGAASTPSLNVTGVPFAGTGTTSFPLVYINDANATASTTLNTAGTYLGVNGDGTQDLMNLLKDGTTKMRVFASGGVSIGGSSDPGAAGFIYLGGGGTGTLSFRNSSDNATEAQFSGFGSSTSFNIQAGSSRALSFGSAGGVQWKIDTSGHMLAATDATYDLGASSTTFRPRDGHFSRNVDVGGTLAVTGASTFTGALNKVTITPPATSATLTIPNGTTLNSGAGGTLGSNAFTSTAYAPLASPALTGNPTAPTQTAADNSTKIATTAYVDAAAGMAKGSAWFDSHSNDISSLVKYGTLAPATFTYATVGTYDISNIASGAIDDSIIVQAWDSTGALGVTIPPSSITGTAFQILVYAPDGTTLTDSARRIQITIIAHP